MRKLNYCKALAAIPSLVLVVGRCAAVAEPSPTHPNKTPILATLRHTQFGDVVGYERDGVVNWLGIPYAKAPLGELRWRAPKSPEGWRGVREALKYGSRCSQTATDVLPLHGHRVDAAEYLQQARYDGSEDCLYLNVYRAAPARHDSTAAALPVMVWLHGGANITGSGEGYGTAAFLATAQVVLVTVNYRLGNFGFFTHPALRTEGTPEDRSGNYGLLDQIQALKWVRENIAAFGGDAKNITVFGISAGGADILGLLGSRKAAGLFQRAIVMSGHELTRSVEAASQPIEQPAPGLPAPSGELLLQLLMLDGTASSRAAAEAWVASASPAAIAKYLRGKSYQEFDRAEAHIVEQKDTAGGETLIRDGTVIPREGIAASLASSHTHNRVPVIIGSVHDEDQPYVLSKAPYADWVSNAQTLELRIKDLKGYRLLSEYATALWKAEDVDELATALARSQSESVFAYRLDWRKFKPWPGPDREPRGATHGMDIPLLFGFPPQPSAIAESDFADYAALSKIILSYWSEFAHTGAPGRGRQGELPVWTAWSNRRSAPKFLVLDSAAGAGLHMSFESLSRSAVLQRLTQDTRLPTIGEKCAFLHRLVTYSTMTPRLLTQDYARFAQGQCVQHTPRMSPTHATN